MAFLKIIFHPDLWALVDGLQRCFFYRCMHEWYVQNRTAKIIIFNYYSIWLIYKINTFVRWICSNKIDDNHRKHTHSTMKCETMWKCNLTFVVSTLHNESIHLIINSFHSPPHFYENHQKEWDQQTPRTNGNCCFRRIHIDTII